MGDQGTDFTIADVVAVQRRLRGALNLGEEHFPLPAFVGMISDEIDRLRQAGRSDAEIAGMIEQASGKVVDPADLARFFADAEARRAGRPG